MRKKTHRPRASLILTAVAGLQKTALCNTASLQPKYKLFCSMKKKKNPPSNGFGPAFCGPLCPVSRRPPKIPKITYTNTTTKKKLFLLWWKKKKCIHRPAALALLSADRCGRSPADRPWWREREACSWSAAVALALPSCPTIVPPSRETLRSPLGKKFPFFVTKLHLFKKKTSILKKKCSIKKNFNI